MIALFLLVGQCWFANNIEVKNVTMPTSSFVSDTLYYEILNDYEDLEQIIQEADENELLIVNFWATWCAPCVKELPYFESFGKTNRSKKVRILLISLDFPKHIRKRYVPFIEKHQLESELFILNDPNENEWIDKVDPSWSGTIPATLFIKGEKRIFTEKEMHSEEDIESYINQL